MTMGSHVKLMKICGRRQMYIPEIGTGNGTGDVPDARMARLLGLRSQVSGLRSRVPGVGFRVAGIRDGRRKTGDGASHGPGTSHGRMGTHDVPLPVPISVHSPVPVRMTRHRGRTTDRWLPAFRFARGHTDLNAQNPGPNHRQSDGEGRLHPSASRMGRKVFVPARSGPSNPHHRGTRF